MTSLPKFHVLTRLRPLAPDRKPEPDRDIDDFCELVRRAGAKRRGETFDAPSEDAAFIIAAGKKRRGEA